MKKSTSPAKPAPASAPVTAGPPVRRTRGRPRKVPAGVKPAGTLVVNNDSDGENGVLSSGPLMSPVPMTAASSAPRVVKPPSTTLHPTLVHRQAFTPFGAKKFLTLDRKRKVHEIETPTPSPSPKRSFVPPPEVPVELPSGRRRPAETLREPIQTKTETTAPTPSDADDVTISSLEFSQLRAARELVAAKDAEMGALKIAEAAAHAEAAELREKLAVDRQLMVDRDQQMEVLRKELEEERRKSSRLRTELETAWKDLEDAEDEVERRIKTHHDTMVAIDKFLDAIRGGPRTDPEDKDLKRRIALMSGEEAAMSDRPPSMPTQRPLQN